MMDEDYKSIADKVNKKYYPTTGSGSIKTVTKDNITKNVVTNKPLLTEEFMELEKLKKESSLLNLATEKLAIIKKKTNPKSGKSEYSLVSKSNVHPLNYFGSKKPSVESAAHEEKRVQYFKNKHASEESNQKLENLIFPLLLGAGAGGMIRSIKNPNWQRGLSGAAVLTGLGGIFRKDISNILKKNEEQVPTFNNQAYKLGWYQASLLCT